MPARVIRLYTPAPARLWQAVRGYVSWCRRRAHVAYLNWRIKHARKDIEYLLTDPWHDPRQIRVHERQINVWEVQILTLENQ